MSALKLDTFLEHGEIHRFLAIHLCYSIRFNEVERWHRFIAMSDNDQFLAGEKCVVVSPRLNMDLVPR